VSLVAKVFVVLNLVASVMFLIFALNVWTAQTKWQKMYEQEKVANVDKLRKIQEREVRLSGDIVWFQQQAASESKLKEALRKQRDDLREEKLVLQTAISKTESDRDMKNALVLDLFSKNESNYEMIVKLKGIVNKQHLAVAMERQNAVNARNEKTDLENELNSTKQSLAAITRDKREVEELLASANSRIEGLIARGIPIQDILGSDARATQPKIADAQVLAVRPDVNLVMISVGSQQNVKPGYEFVISRGSDYIATVQVEKVYPDMCSARVKTGFSKGEVQIHDEAKSGR
jgi:hypothetical protein